jgi:hypothetical protein
VNLFVDASLWSLALRRAQPEDEPTVARLSDALIGGEPVLTTGLVFQELLQGFAGPKARGVIIERFSALPLPAIGRRDRVAAASSATPAVGPGSRSARSMRFSPGSASGMT